MKEPKAPPVLDLIADKVLEFRPKPKSAPAKNAQKRVRNWLGDQRYNSRKKGI